MRVTPLGENCYQLATWAILFPVNCYLVREDDGFTLIDTGMPGNTARFLRAAQRLGAPITRIALTHAHMDHIGSLDALHAALPAAAVLFTDREARILDGDRQLLPDEPPFPIRGGYPKVTTRPSQPIQPGDHVGSLEVIAAPGHTPGQVAFFDSRDRTLIAGDTLSTYTGIAVAGISRPLFPFLAMGTWHLPTAIATVERHIALQPRRLAVGHGAALTEPAALMQRAIDVARQRVREPVAHGA